MAYSAFDFADIIDRGLSDCWRKYKHKLSHFLRHAGVNEGEHSQCLYILAAYPEDPGEYLRGLQTELDDNGQWAVLRGSDASGTGKIVIAFPVDSKVRISELEPRQALEKALLALFIEVHSRLVVWWLVNAW